MKQEDKLRMYEKLVSSGMSSSDIIGTMVEYLNKKDALRASRMEMIKRLFF